MDATIRVIRLCKMHINFSFRYLFLAAATLIIITLSSCNDKSVDLDSSSPFITSPGTRIGNINDAWKITWLSNSDQIAYTAVALNGSMIQGSVNVVDLQSGSIRVLDPGIRIFNSFDAAGDSIFYSTTDGTFLVSGTASSTVIVPILQVTHGGMLSHDHRLIAFWTPMGDSIVIRNLKEGSSVSFPSEREEYAYTFSPDSKKLLLTSGRILNLSDGSSTMVYFPSRVRSVRWYSDGIWALSFGPDSDQTYLLTNVLDGTSSVLWRSETNDVFGFSEVWSSDGKKLAFLRTTPMNISPIEHYLYMCDVATKSASRVVAVKVRSEPLLRGISSFAFSPDNNRVVYSVEGKLYYQDI